MLEAVEYQMLKETRNVEGHDMKNSQMKIYQAPMMIDVTLVGGFSSRSVHKNGPVDTRIHTWLRLAVSSRRISWSCPM